MKSSQWCFFLSVSFVTLKLGDDGSFDSFWRLQKPKNGFSRPSTPTPKKSAANLRDSKPQVPLAWPEYHWRSEFLRHEKKQSGTSNQEDEEERRALEKFDSKRYFGSEAARQIYRLEKRQ